MAELILASASPRRKELLALTGLKFKIIPAKGEEVIHAPDPEGAVTELSIAKAKEVAAQACDGDVVIGADTVVAFDGKILGKPHSKQQAFEMLEMLQGNMHQVYTGVCVIEKGKGIVASFSEHTKVYVVPMTSAEIREYIATGEPMDKAGAYAIQGVFGKYISKIEGDHNNVIGLPLARLWSYLKEYKEKLQ